MSLSKEHNILEQYENMRKSGKKGSGFKWLILLAIIAILSIAGFLMPRLKTIFSGSNDPIPPFEIVIPKKLEISDNYFTIQIEDSEGKIMDYNQNIHRGIEFTKILLDREKKLKEGNKIIPCLSLSPDDIELFIEWEVTDSENWGKQTDSDYPIWSYILSLKKITRKQIVHLNQQLIMLKQLVMIAVEQS